MLIISRQFANMLQWQEKVCEPFGISWFSAIGHKMSSDLHLSDKYRQTQCTEACNTQTVMMCHVFIEHIKHSKCWWKKEVNPWI